MSIMTAKIGLAGNLRPVGKVGNLPDGQGIQFRPEHQGRAIRHSGENSCDAIASDSGYDIIYACCLESLRHNFCGVALFSGDFGMPVKAMPDLFDAVQLDAC